MQWQWIAPGKDYKRKNLYFMARASFFLDTVPAPQALRIAVESYYKLWVNGRPLGMGPARGSRGINFYDSYEVSSLLQPGRNMVGILVQSMNIPNYTTCPAGAALLVDVEGLTASGDDSWEILVNDEWREDVEVFCVQTGFMEWRDLRKEPKGWLTGNDGEKWTRPLILGPAEGTMNGKRLLPRPVPFMSSRTYCPSEVKPVSLVPALRDQRSVEVASALSFSPRFPCDDDLPAKCSALASGTTCAVRIDPVKDGGGVSLVFNFSREVIGFFELELSSPAGAIVDIGYDEELEDGRMNVSRNHQYHMADRYMMRAGRQIAGNTLHERGFRFVEVILRNFKAPVVLHSARAIDRRYPYANRGSFNSSDMLLNRIWDMCVETLSACTTDVFNDCPWRERAFWVNDLIVENIASLQAFGDPVLNAHALRLALSNAREDGWIPGVCPDNGGKNMVLVATNLFLPLMLKDHFLYSGDAKLVEEVLPQMLKVMELFKDHMDEDSLIKAPDGYWNFLDWSYESNGMSLNGKNTSLLNWLHCMALAAAAWLLEQTGRAKEAKVLSGKIPAIARSIGKRFWTERERYADWLEEGGALSAESSQLAHAFALLSGSIPEGHRASAIAALDDASLLKPELYLHHFVVNAMRDSGLHRNALARIRKHWGTMAQSGSPTVWEAVVHEKGKKALKNAGSLCHGFGTTPINFFQTAILGVRPTAPGFKRFSVKPYTGGLAFAGGRIPTPAGCIHLEWRRKGGSVDVSLDIPATLTAETAAGTLSSGQHNFNLSIEGK